METAVRDRKRTFLKVTCVVLAIILMIGIAAVVALIVHENRGSGEVKVENGLSAYELAVQYGYEGTMQEWLDSLNGRSAYEIAVANGYSGTEAEWSAALANLASGNAVGVKTASFNSKGELVLTLTDDTTVNIGKAQGINGSDGKNGIDGKDGADGENGADGKDGIGITNVDINTTGELVLMFSDGKNVNVGKVVGTAGAKGENGLSAYEIALMTGNTTAATEDEWIESLKGEKGDQGEQGIQGIQGDKGDTGATGAQGPQGEQGEKGDKGDTGVAGENGLSAYEIAQANGVTLSEQEWLASLKGEKGETGAQGNKGETGAAGQNGLDGKSAYEIAKFAGLTTAQTEAEWIESLKGEKGDQGEQGIQGEKGDQGEQGIQGEKGDQGEQGIQGEKGDQGEQGIQGIQGEKGDTGAAGADGLSAYELAIKNGLTTAATEELWLESLKGETGAAGAQGEKGDKGDTGATGEQGVGIKNISIANGTMTVTLTNDHIFTFENVVGADGQDGEDGITPQIRINATTNLWEISTDEGATWTSTGVNATGEKGEQGIQGIQGEKGDTGATGAQGEKGDKGDIGATGAAGEDGITPQIRINATTNLWEISTDNGVTWTSTDVPATGEKGEQGEQGIQGETGLSAYEIALLTGKTTAATEAEWIESLKGEKGDTGATGATGVQGEKGEKGDTGDTGAAGADGLSAYEIAQSHGVTLSEQEWLESLKGEKGDTGATGATGAAGQDGQDGKSAYEIAKFAGLTTAQTEAEWIESLKGAKGDTGAQGEKGEKGDTGAAGADGLSAYELAVKNGLTTAATEAQWLESLKGEQGIQGEKGDTGAQGEKGDKGDQGIQGEKGDKGDAGVGVTGVSVNENNYLVITLSKGEPIVLEQSIVGEKGDKGDTGATGNGIKAVTLTAEYMLVFTMDDDTTMTVGPVRGEKGEQGEQGIQGIQGETGATGATGAQGPQGIQGEAGADGLTPYLSMDAEGNLYVKYGDEGTLSLLANIKGPKGDKGDTGETGEKGDKGDTGATGAQGIQGVQGEQGPQGENGEDGVDGKSAYELYKEAYPDYTGTMEQWLASLKGEQGDPGADGVGITKTEIIDGDLWITYSNDPENPVNVGCVQASASESSGTEGLAYYPLPDGTYAVSGGTTEYLTEIQIPATHNGKAVTKIRESGFADYTNLQKLILPTSIITIETDAFSGCSNISEVYYSGTVDQWAQINFAATTSTPIKTATSLYINGELLTSALFSEGTTEIKTYAFYNYTTLTSVQFPETLTSLGDNSFTKTALKNVTLPSNLTYLGSGVFAGCSSLTEVTFPYSDKNWTIEGITTVSGGTSGTKYRAYNSGGEMLYLVQASGGTRYEYADLSSPSAVAKLLTSQTKFGSATWTAINLYNFAWTCS